MSPFPAGSATCAGPHRVEEERAYQVTRIVLLPELDYENFSEDLLADRAFLRPGGDGCLLITTRHRRDGILVYAKGDRVQRAAYFSGVG